MKELHVKNLLPVRLDKYLMDQYPALGLGRLNKALRENKIKLNGKKQPLSTRVQNGDTIRLFLSDDQLESRPTPAAVFVYEDDDIIIANKPAGLTVDGGDADTLVKRVQAKLAAEGKPTHAVLCHRLDTGTSGLVLLAKNNAAEAFLTEAIKKREIEKRYLCVTFGRPNPPRRSAAGLPAEGRRARHRAHYRHDGGRREGSHHRLRDTSRQRTAGPAGSGAGHWPHPPDPCAFGAYRLPHFGRQQVRQQRRQPRTAAEVPGTVRMGIEVPRQNQQRAFCPPDRAGIPCRETVVLPAG